ncbi:GNAT family N-acetyltransferase [Xanthomonas sp. AM6]|uniref:GNAT family N-acetyltransferase n=1 Tax=Xanthomonas sp. AM6 TaxID=2982531 RepID=UPI0021DB6A87|nr:GNAT family N-acetyltransferase [Xanthomonas sp. AM6]UYB50955.1 GNAT family N-acetyltransferase [Xanthomonas sp. AM6]
MNVRADDDGYVVEAEVPSVEDYRRLRVAAGLSPKSQEAAVRGLPNSCFAVTVRHQGRAVGMGRIVGDGGCFFQIVDIAVEPAHQRRGLGRRIMAALHDWLSAHAAEGAYVSLIADGDARHLYAQFGFVETAPASVGMARVVRRQARAG